MSLMVSVDVKHHDYLLRAESHKLFKHAHTHTHKHNKQNIIIMIGNL